MALAAAACQSQKFSPAGIEASDMCSFCRMAISEKRYAAEVVDQEGNLFKFDDIGCMVHFVRDHNLKGRAAAYFVVDFEQRNWLEGERAYYVKAEAIHSPMGGGLIAFRDRTKAEQYAPKLNGRVLTFDDVTKQ